MAGNNDAFEDLTMPTDAELGIEPAGGETDGGIDQGGAADDGAGDAAPAGRGGSGARPTVPLPEVQATRDRLRAAEAELTRLREVEKEKIRYEERVNFHQQQQRQAQQLEAERLRLEAEEKAKLDDPMPDKDIDGIEAVNEWRYRKLEEKLARQEQDREKAAQRTQVERATDLRRRVISSVAQEYTAFENAYGGKEETADYEHAFNHVVEVYAARFARRGVPDDRQLGPQKSRMMMALEGERARLIRDCLELNEATGEYQWMRDPAHLIYQEAIDLGFQPAGRRAAAELDPEVVAMVASARTGATVRPMRAPSPRTEMLANSASAAARAGGGRTAAPVVPQGKLTLQQINQMSDEEFGRHLEERAEEMKEAMSPNG